MNSLPKYRPKQLNLGPLESEIVALIWQLGIPSAKEIHDQILTDPDRDLTYPSVMTVLRRLEQKGWVACRKDPAGGRLLFWEALITKEAAHSLEAYQQLQRFLAVGDADVVAAFAADLDRSSVDKIEAIANRLKAMRQARNELSNLSPNRSDDGE